LSQAERSSLQRAYSRALVLTCSRVTLATTWRLSEIHKTWKIHHLQLLGSRSWELEKSDKLRQKWNRKADWKDNVVAVSRRQWDTLGIPHLSYNSTVEVDGYFFQPRSTRTTPRTLRHLSSCGGLPRHMHPRPRAAKRARVSFDPVLPTPMATTSAQAVPITHPTGGWGEALVFGGCAFPPVSLAPAGDCPCRYRVEALSPGLPEIKEKSGIWNLVPVG